MSGGEADPGRTLGCDPVFVLSGYLITRLLIDEVNQSGRVNLGSLYYKRGLRLFPGLVALCAVLLVAGIEW